MEKIRKKILNYDKWLLFAYVYSLYWIDLVSAVVHPLVQQFGFQVIPVGKKENKEIIKTKTCKK